MSAVCTLPQPVRLAYAVRWSNPWEKYPRNSKTRRGGGPAIFGDAGDKSSPQAQCVATLSFPQIAELRKPLLGRTGIVRPNAASPRGCHRNRRRDACRTSTDLTPLWIGSRIRRAPASMRACRSSRGATARARLKHSCWRRSCCHRCARRCRTRSTSFPPPCVWVTRGGAAWLRCAADETRCLALRVRGCSGWRGSLPADPAASAPGQQIRPGTRPRPANNPAPKGAAQSCCYCRA